MGKSSISASQATNAHDMSTEPMLISGFGLAATRMRTLSMSKPVVEYAFVKEVDMCGRLNIVEGKPSTGTSQGTSICCPDTSI